MASEKLIDIVKDAHNVLHTFPVQTPDLSHPRKRSTRRRFRLPPTRSSCRPRSWISCRPEIT